MSIRTPVCCSRCGLYGHNRRRCHEIIQDDDECERRGNENFEKHVAIHRRIEQERQQEEELQQLREQNDYNRQHINALQRQIRRLQQSHQPQSQPQSQPQPSRPQLRRTDSFVLTRDHVMAYILHQGNEYKKLLTGPEALKTPHPEVYVSESCPVCMDTLGKTNVTTMLCGHQICTGCFARNIIECKSNCCPVCRDKVI